MHKPDPHDSGTTSTAYVADPDAGTVDVVVPWYDASDLDSFGANFSTGAYDDLPD